MARDGIDLELWAKVDMVMVLSGIRGATYGEMRVAMAKIEDDVIKLLIKRVLQLREHEVERKKG